MAASRIPDEDVTVRLLTGATNLNTSWLPNTIRPLAQKWVHGCHGPVGCSPVQGTGGRIACHAMALHDAVYHCPWQRPLPCRLLALHDAALTGTSETTQARLQDVLNLLDNMVFEVSRRPPTRVCARWGDAHPAARAGSST